MITDSNAIQLPISELKSGSIFQCPQSHEFFIVVQETIETGTYINCVRLKDGAPKNYVVGPSVDWYPSARLAIDVNS